MNFPKLWIAGLSAAVLALSGTYLWREGIPSSVIKSASNTPPAGQLKDYVKAGLRILHNLLPHDETSLCLTAHGRRDVADHFGHGDARVGFSDFVRRLGERFRTTRRERDIHALTGQGNGAGPT